MKTLKAVALLTAVTLSVSAFCSCDDEKSNTENSSVVSVSSVAEEPTLEEIYRKELEDTLEKLTLAQTADGFSYIFFTDAHIDYANERPVIERQMEAIIELANTSKVDCVILGGDMIHGTSDRYNSLDDLRYFVTEFKKCNVPVYAVRGNHDANDYHGSTATCHIGQIIDQAMWTDNFVDPLSRNTVVHDSTDPKSTYYYVDFPEKKTRLITLDPYNYPVIPDEYYYCHNTAESWNRYDQKQLDWLASTAISKDLDGWQYIIASHASVVSSGTGQVDVVKQILTALNHGQKYTTSDGTVLDYAEYNSYAPLNASGHNHSDSSRYDDDIKMLSIITNSGKVSYPPRRTAGNLTEATFDAITVAKDGKVRRIAFGAGRDGTYSIAKYHK